MHESLYSNTQNLRKRIAAEHVCTCKPSTLREETGRDGKLAGACLAVATMTDRLRGIRQREKRKRERKQCCLPASTNAYRCKYPLTLHTHTGTNSKSKPGIVIYTCSPSTWEVGVGSGFEAYKVTSRLAQAI